MYFSSESVTQQVHIILGVLVERINSRFHQEQLLKQAGLDEINTLPFTQDFSELSPEGFVRRFLVEPYNLRQVVVGYDYRFGCQRAGDFKTLETLGKQLVFLVQEVPPLQLGGRTVSSTLVRQMIRENQFEQLPMYLGSSKCFPELMHLHNIAFCYSCTQHICLPKIDMVAVFNPPRGRVLAYCQSAWSVERVWWL